MATAKQVCVILDDVLRLPENTTRWHADRLRTARMLPSTQGIPEQLEPIHIGAILVAVVTRSHRVAEYMAMLPAVGSPTFGETLAGCVEAPNDIFEIQIDAAAPGATVTFRRHDRGMQTLAFAPDSAEQRPAFDTLIRIGPDVLIRLTAAIQSAPPVRAGRPPVRDRYRRVERATIY